MNRTIKHISLLVAALFTLAGNAFAQTNDELFRQANEQYKQGSFEQSAALYNKILAQGYESATLYYNLGNAEFRLGDLGGAILNYERAHRLDPSDNDIQANLEFARSKTTDNVNEIPRFFLARWADSIIALLSTNGWAVLCIVLMVIVCALWAMFFLVGSFNGKKATFFSALALTVLLAVAFANLYVSNNRANSHNEAIVMMPAITVKTSPESDATDKFLLHEGTKVTVDETINDWSKIKLADGNTGWTENTNIEKI